MIFNIIDILSEVVTTGFKTIIPIAFFYGLFVYILLRDAKEMEQDKLEKPKIKENIVTQDIILTPYYLTYHRKPLHNKFKNDYKTKQVKQRNRKDRQSIRQRRLWWKNYYSFL